MQTTAPAQSMHAIRKPVPWVAAASCGLAGCRTKGAGKPGNNFGVITISYGTASGRHGKPEISFCEYLRLVVKFGNGEDRNCNPTRR